MSDESNSPVAARILIVEDEMIVAQHLALILKDMGYQVAGMASTGALAIQLAEESKPALVLMDVNLPGEIDGIEASEQIRARLDIPVVFLSAYDEKDVLHRAKKTEPYGYIAKPFSQNILRITIETALYKHGSDKRVRESEERFRKVFEQGPIGMGLVGTHGRFLVANSQLCQMLGYTEDELTRLTFVDITHPDHVTQDLEAVRRLSTGEIPYYKAEKRYIKKDGDILWGNLTAAVIRDAEGKLLYALPMIEDITDHKRAEEALRKSEEQYRAVFDNAGIGIDLLDREGRIIQVNQSLLSMLGYAEEEIYALTFADITHPDDREISKRKLDSLMAGEIDSYRLEKRYLRKDGRIVWGDLWTSAIRDATGEHTGTVGVIADITERKKAEEALRESEEKHRAILANIEEGYFEVDVAGNMTFCNEPLSRMLGYTKEELIGMNNREYMDANNAKRVYNAFNRVYGTGKPEEMFGWRLVRKDGTPKDVEASVSLIKDSEGRPLGFRGVVRDVTERARAAEELRKREEMLRAILAASPIGILFTQDRRIKWANDSWAKMFGFAHEDEYLDQSTSLMYPSQENYEHARKMLYEHAKPGQVSEAEAGLRRKDGTLFDGLIRIDLLDPSDPSKGTISAITDISERKKAQEALRKTSEQFQAVIQASPLSIIVFDQKSIVKLWNPASEAIFGWSATEATGKFLPFVAEDKKEEHFGIRERALQGERLSGIEARRKRKDGSPIDVIGSTAPLHDSKGSVTGIMALFLDITDRKKSEESLRQSEKKYRTLFEDSIDALFMVTADGTLIDANQAYFDLLGYEKEEIVGHNVLKTYADPVDRQRYHQKFGDKGFVRDYPLRLVRKDGRNIDCLVSSRIERDKEGNILGYRGFLRDVTGQKELERQLLQAQKMEAIGTLAGGIAHDFNNLLQVTMGYSEVLLSRKDKADPEYGRLQQILQAGRSGAELVQRLLTLSRKTESKQRPIDLNHQIKQVQRLLDRTIPKMIKIELRLADSLATVNADPTQIEQIIMNLAVNARDVMPEGGKLTLSTENITLDEEYCRRHHGAKPGKYVLLAISDTGSGMDKEILDHMFEPFFTTKGVGRGTGLGLAVVYGIVKQHAGYVTCESQPGHGYCVQGLSTSN